MTTNDMIIDAAKTTDVTTTKADGNEKATDGFVAFRMPIEQIRETMIANLGNSTISVADLDRIRIPGGGGTMWVLPDISGDQNVKELTGVILMCRDERMYWSLPMEQSGRKTRPDCYAPDALRGIGSPGGDCNSCEFARFGSARTGQGKACKQFRQVFLLLPGNLLPVIVSLPVSSIKPSQQYLTRLLMRGLRCFSLLTNIGLEKDRNAQGIEFSRATFSSGEPLPPETAKRAEEYATLIKSLVDAAPPAPFVAIQPEEGEVI